MRSGPCLCFWCFGSLRILENCKKFPVVGTKEDPNWFQFWLGKNVFQPLTGTSVMLGHVSLSVFACAFFYSPYFWFIHLPAHTSSLLFSFLFLLQAQIPLYIVVGKPIPVPKNPNPTEKEIDAVHATYMQELEQLFEKHKEECGYGDRTLTVI